MTFAAYSSILNNVDHQQHSKKGVMSSKVRKYCLFQLGENYLVISQELADVQTAVNSILRPSGDKDKELRRNLN